MFQRPEDHLPHAKSQFCDLVNVFGGSDSTLDDIYGFPPQGVQHAVSDKARSVHVDTYRLFSEAATKFDGCLDCLLAASFSLNDFHQRHQVGGTPKVRPHELLWEAAP